MVELRDKGDLFILKENLIISIGTVFLCKILILAKIGNEIDAIHEMIYHQLSNFMWITNRPHSFVSHFEGFNLAFSSIQSPF